MGPAVRRHLATVRRHQIFKTRPLATARRHQIFKTRPLAFAKSGQFSFQCNEMSCYDNSLQDIKVMLKKNNGYLSSEPFRRLQSDLTDYLKQT